MILARDIQQWYKDEKAYLYPAMDRDKLMLIMANLFFYCEFIFTYSFIAAAVWANFRQLILINLT